MQTNVHTELEGIKELVEFASADPWTAARVVQERTESILREVGQKRALWRHNKLLSALLMAALDEAEQAQTHKSAVVAEEAGRMSDDAGSDFVAVDDADPLMCLTKDETQARLESFFLQTHDDVTEASVHEFLETRVFAPRASFSKQMTMRVELALNGVRYVLREFAESFRQEVVPEDNVAMCVRGMLCDKGGFSDDVVAFLTDVQSNDDLQAEFAHVLTIQLSNLDEFAWPATGVPVEIKRGMNSRFRRHLQQEALTALLFIYIGTVWAAELQHACTLLLKALESDDAVRKGSITHTRKAMVDKFRLSALLWSLGGTRQTYDKSSNDTSNNAKDDASKPINKQDIVRLVYTEAHFGPCAPGARRCCASEHSGNHCSHDRPRVLWSERLARRGARDTPVPRRPRRRPHDFPHVYADPARVPRRRRAEAHVPRLFGLLHDDAAPVRSSAL